MGLLDRAIASNNATSAAASVSVDANALIADFSRKNPLFHCIVLQGVAVQNIADMLDSYGAKCMALPAKKCLALLPGALDRELFAHRLSRSSGSLVLFQSSAHSPSPAIEILSPYFG
jgi:hypothetical protein